MHGTCCLKMTHMHACMQVTEDEELLAWYKEAKEEGHPDKLDGWIQLTDIASLVQILATMAWIGCGHVPFSCYYAKCHSVL